MNPLVQAAPDPTARARAIVLLSGGLDSTLAISLMQEQDIEVLALNFVGPFCTCSGRKEGGCHVASQVAQRMGIPIRVIAKGPDYLELVAAPRFGRGRGLNPCIDCRIYMLRRAAALMGEVGASFVVTGEVLGQRPMSQHRAALNLIERESGLAGRLLRPLSAHLLPPTLPEQQGVVDRARLLAIRGRARADQLRLVREKDIDLFGCPSGGCLLTDPAVARRLRDVFERCPGWDLRDARLATLGRHFRLTDQLKVILGRNQTENRRLAEIAWGLLRAEFTAEPGPTAVLRGSHQPADLATLGRLMRFFAKKATASAVEIRLLGASAPLTWLAAERASKDEVVRFAI